MAFMGEYMNMAETTTTTTTTTLNPDIYRFSGFRYGLRGCNKYGPDDYIPQERGLFAFPSGDEAKDPSTNIYEPDAPI